MYVEGLKKCNSEKNEFEYEKLLKNWLKMNIENYLFEEKVDDCAEWKSSWVPSKYFCCFCLIFVTISLQDVNLLIQPKIKSFAIRTLQFTHIYTSSWVQGFIVGLGIFGGLGMYSGFSYIYIVGSGIYG